MPWTHHDTREAAKLSHDGWRIRKKAEAEMDNERTKANWALKHAEDYLFWLTRADGAKAAGLDARDYEAYADQKWLLLANSVLGIQEAKAGKDIAFMVSARAVEEIADELRSTHGITGGIEEIIAMVARHMYTRAIVPASSEVPA